MKDIQGIWYQCFEKYLINLSAVPAGVGEQREQMQQDISSDWDAFKECTGDFFSEQKFLVEDLKGTICEVDERAMVLDKKTGKLTLCLTQFMIPTQGCDKATSSYSYYINRRAALNYNAFWYGPCETTDNFGILISYQFHRVFEVDQLIRTTESKSSLGNKIGDFNRIIWFLFDPKKGFRKIDEKHEIAKRLIENMKIMNELGDDF